jgi:two-component sensor histidine kinase/CHASE3 domain sensor protein
MSAATIENLPSTQGSLMEVDTLAAALDIKPALSSRTERRQRRAMQGIGLGFTLLVVICVAAAILSWKNAVANRTVMHAISARQAVDQSMEQILLAESSQRGFLLTHDARFLPDYKEGLADFSGSLAALKQSTAGDADLMRLAAAFERLAVAKFEVLDQTIALAEAGQFPQAMALVQTGLGERKMADARGTVRALAEALDVTIQQNGPWQQLLPKVLLLTIGMASICVIALSAVVLRDTHRNLHVLASREQALRRLAATLEDKVQRRTRSLTQANQRFDAALRAARVTVFTQDKDLAFTWVSHVNSVMNADAGGSRENHEDFPNDSIDAVVRIKQLVLDTGEPGHGEVRLATPVGFKWFDLNVHPQRDVQGDVVGLIGGSVEITERKEQEARIRLLMREVTHRSKNLLAVIQAIMRQTAAHSLSIEDFQKRFADRLHSLAGSHDLLVQENWNGASLRELIRSQLGHYSDLVGSQIRLSGPEIQLRPDAAQHIGMSLHELATNAAKYGALSVPEGQVAISWTLPSPGDAAMACTLQWVETDGPAVIPPTRRGFGRVVIERMVARALDGEVEMDYLPEGARWKLSFPIANLA